ncbi:MAG: Trm112 family protein [Candidatus Parabeggiatoa sp. nov. 2]|nr:MAG: tetraacyldisaccharide 4'-kinase [Beggiatoa sp. 4572_84]RKZ59855.1 MAG: Trm112 family protein [Gammaproteobacteria bacterium]
MEKRLLDILICPVTKGPLIYDKDNHELLCKSSRLAYPIRDGIPVMLSDEARSLTLEEVEQLKSHHG